MSEIMPKNIVLSLDGLTYRFLQEYLESGELPKDQGLGYLASKGVFVPSTVITPSLTAPSHIAIATGSTAAKNNINANSFHLIRSPFNSNISGFGAPIGGYDTDIHGDHEDFAPSAEPLWVNLREAGKKVVAATFPGADGATVTLPGVTPSVVIQEDDIRTVDYTVPFGTFGGVGARGFSLSGASFNVNPTQAVVALTRLNIPFYGDVKVANLETIAGTSLTGGSSAANYNIQVAVLDTSNDQKVNYDELIVFDANVGIERLSNTSRAPLTGSAFLTPEQAIAPFFFPGSNNVVGASFILTELKEDLSSVNLLRTSANFIPRPANNPAVLANVDDINNNIGFWRPQPDFRIPQRSAPGLENFTDLELDAAYRALDETFVDYQTAVFLRGAAQVPNADLVMGYLEQPDGSEHQYLLTDPRQATDPSNPNTIGAGQDQAKVERYAANVLHAYETVSKAVQTIIDTVGVDAQGLPKSNIVVVSDHGFQPFHTAVNMRSILLNAGFNESEVRAVSSGPAVNIYINVEGREPNGTVNPSRYQALQTQIRETLKSLVDTNPNYVPAGSEPLFDQIYHRQVPNNPTSADIIQAQSEFIGQDTGDVFALLSLGYNFDGFQSTVTRLGDAAPPANKQPILSVPTFYGAHGYDPNLPEMKAVFLAAGPDFNPTTLPNLTEIRTIDIAPTILDILDVPPAATVEGKSIFELSLPPVPSEVFGTPGDDDFDSVLGTKGFIGKGQNIFTSGGNDSVDVSQALGGNRIDAGSGDDLIFAGTNNRILAGSGADRIFLGYPGGNNVVTGGGGADQFWLVTDAVDLPTNANTITDFALGTDVIGFAGTNLNFAALDITQMGANTVIGALGQDLAVLQNVQASLLTANNFVFA